MHIELTIQLNGTSVTMEVEPRETLADVLRDRCKLTGTHIGCDTSSCGSCTVLVDGKAIKSCSVLAVQVADSEIITIEGLSQNGELHPLQEGFNEKHGLQCGFCTPGMIMMAADLLASNPTPSDQEIRESLEGNFCRCTGYHNIVESIQYAAEKMSATT